MKQDLAVSVPVRVSLPASVASEIGSLKKALGSILDMTGCPKCCSGMDIFFDTEREIVLPEIGKMPSIAIRGGRMGLSRPDKEPVRVGLQPEFASSIDNVFLAIDKIAELSGHTSCTSGRDFLFQMERSLVLDAKLNLKERVMSVG